MANINIIVAVGRNGEIGKNNNLVWHIREDLRHFKRVTLGHPVIMGRKTWLSLPNGPLPGRRNIVLTTNTDFLAEGAETAASLEDGIGLCDSDEEIFIIGGESVYREASKRADRVILTMIDDEDAQADAYFPMEILNDFEIEDAGEPMVDANGLPFRFVTYRRKTV